MSSPTAQREAASAVIAQVTGALPLQALAGHRPLHLVVFTAVVDLAGLAFLNGMWGPLSSS